MSLSQEETEPGSQIQITICAAGVGRPQGKFPFSGAFLCPLHRNSLESRHWPTSSKGLGVLLKPEVSVVVSPPITLGGHWVRG